MYDVGTTNSTAMGAPSPVPSLPQVEYQTKRLIDLMNDATKMQIEIEERLRAVCKPDEPSAPGTAPTPVLVPLAEKLSEVGDRLAALCRSQRGLLNRLEL